MGLPAARTRYPEAALWPLLGVFVCGATQAVENPSQQIPAPTVATVDAQPPAALILDSGNDSAKSLGLNVRDNVQLHFLLRTF